ncbi:MAG: hypothetical protein WEB04_05720 [Dehalococcoidia bacterium]
MRPLVALIALTLFLIACGGGNGDAPAPTACRDPTVRIPTGEIPTAAPGSMIPRRCGDDGPATVPFPTATPEAALSPDEALAQLLDMPNVGPALRAALDGDVDGLLALVDWQPYPCGLPRGSSEACPDGVAAGTELPSTNVGESVPFWVREEHLRPVLDDLLAGSSLVITFASRNQSMYYVGLQGATRPVRPSHIFADPGTGTGVFLVIDSAAEQPIARLRPLVGEGRAAEYAALYGYTDYDIIAYGP